MQQQETSLNHMPYQPKTKILYTNHDAGHQLDIAK